VILSKVDEDAEVPLKEMLKGKEIEVAAILPYSAEINKLNRTSEPGSGCLAPFDLLSFDYSVSHGARHPFLQVLVH
jgi:hypothetical protein